MRNYDVYGRLAAMEIFSHEATYPPSEYPPAEGRPVGAAMGGASCVAGAMRGEARSGLSTNPRESTRTGIRENPCPSVAKTSPRLYTHDGNKNVSEAVAAAILSMINNFLGHIPGSSPIDYPFVSPRECACNGEAAEKACLVEVDKMALKYIADYAASAAVARVIDLIVAILSIHLNPSVAAAFSADGMIGLVLNAKAAAEIMEGANKAKQNNCSCSQYEH